MTIHFSSTIIKIVPDSAFFIILIYDNFINNCVFGCFESSVWTSLILFAPNCRKSQNIWICYSAVIVYFPKHFCALIRVNGARNNITLNTLCSLFIISQTTSTVLFIIFYLLDSNWLWWVTYTIVTNGSTS